MKVAIYTIAKNEEAHVEKWFNSVLEADYHLICDTGSSDKTVKTAQALGIRTERISVQPWRFDDSRNAALALLPDDVDYCISLDMDEVLVPGWRDLLQDAFDAGIQWPKYDYVFGWASVGVPSTIFEGIKIHPRWGVRWKYPIHEIPVACQGVFHKWGKTSIQMHHFQDASKPRSSYFPMLEIAVQEDPQSARLAYYLAREYYYLKRYEEATQEFHRYLSFSDYYYPAEQSEALRFLAIMNPESAEHYFSLSAEKDPTSREPLLDLSQYYSDRSEWTNSLNSAREALKITNQQIGHTANFASWSWRPHDLIALASYYLGDFSTALEHGQLALGYLPEDPRLLKNLDFYLEKTSLGSAKPDKNNSKESKLSA